MTSGEFIEATSRLEKYFERNYTTEQLQIMYEELKNLSIDRYKQIIARCIRNYKLLPRIAHILEIVNNLIGNVSLFLCIFRHFLQSVHTRISGSEQIRRKTLNRGKKYSIISFSL